eukprot:gnl/TRDRNA2_/TRDRNA2_36685_c0_seq1.p1 gnl/TRDRNA2_/TRDRNA2_36685_c0~~gnl/TRDRNA2_/TRDRNA2_36685_c0_seq1.p1  ORF type:complete len:531 (-),score=61.95 gnl/TRDRNA2_/TRDRNA2_36685_c0_seq1:115-1707(-)
MFLHIRMLIVLSCMLGVTVEAADSCAGSASVGFADGNAQQGIACPDPTEMGHISLLQTKARLVRAQAAKTHASSDPAPTGTWDMITVAPFKKPWRSSTFIATEDFDLGAHRTGGNHITVPAGRILHRPTWQKSLRCHGRSEESCEECSTEDDCWSFVIKKGALPPERPVVEAVAGNWIRYVNVIHVQCNYPRMFVNIDFKELSNAKMRVRWDNAEVTRHTEGAQLWFINAMKSGAFSDRNLPDMDFPLVGDDSGNIQGKEGTTYRSRHFQLHLDLPAAISGGHVLEIELEPLGPEGRPSRLELRQLIFFAPTSFAMCQDTKMCMRRLTGEEGWKLRNTNILQKKCLSESYKKDPILKSEGVKKVCNKWRKCLRSRRVSLNSLLEAAGVGEFVASPSTQDPSSGECLYPPFEDPESWDCDCYEEMLKRCKRADLTKFPKGYYTEKMCLRAHFCMNARVCSAWKAVACKGAVEHMQTALHELDKGTHGQSLVGSVESALQKRSVLPSFPVVNASSLSLDSKLDDAGASKRCA